MFVGGHRKWKGSSSGVFVVLFLFCSFFFLLFLTVNKQTAKFLFILPHDVDSFHSYHFCGELITLINSCEEGVPGCVAVMSLALVLCFFWFFFWSRAGWLGGAGGGKVEAERKSERCQILSDSATTKWPHKQHRSTPPLSLTPVTSDLSASPPPPNTPPPSFPAV